MKENVNKINKYNFKIKPQFIAFPKMPLATYFCDFMKQWSQINQYMIHTPQCP